MSDTESEFDRDERLRIIRGGTISGKGEVVFSLPGDYRHNIYGASQEVVDAIRTTIGTAIPVTQRSAVEKDDKINVYVGTENPAALLAEINAHLARSR